jgi:TPP-dependent 2-oxoacid decarboxylase
LRQRHYDAEHVAYETERLIAEALYHWRPVYMGFPADLATQPVPGCAQPISNGYSDPNSLEAANLTRRKSHSLPAEISGLS